MSPSLLAFIFFVITLVTSNQDPAATCKVNKNSIMVNEEATNKVNEIDFEQLTSSQFYLSFLCKSSPLLIRNIDKHLNMSAYFLWKNDNHIRDQIGLNLFKIASLPMSSSTVFAPWEKKIEYSNMTINDLFNAYNDTNRIKDYYLGKRLLPTILHDDIKNKINNKIIPPFAEFMEKGLLFTYFWYTNNNITNSAAHFDEFENLLTVYTGKKIIKLVNKREARWIYPKPKEQYSHLDFYNVDLKKYPLFKNANPLIAEINVGDMLYIPANWYHHVLTLNRTIATTLWFRKHKTYNYKTANVDWFKCWTNI